MRTLEMFDKPRKPRQWRMNVCDAGDGPCSCDKTPISVRYSCSRCGYETGWIGARKMYLFIAPAAVAKTLKRQTTKTKTAKKTQKAGDATNAGGKAIQASL